MAKQFPPEDRRRIAAKVGVNEQYLYQCLTGRREMGPVEAVRIQRESDHEVRVWDVCHKTWALIWPHLIGTDGAPSFSVQSTTGAPVEQGA